MREGFCYLNIILFFPTQSPAHRVSLSVPHTSDGEVVVREQRQRPSEVAAPEVQGAAAARRELARFPVYRILFFARGNVDGNEAACFAFTTVHGKEGEGEQLT